MKNKQSKQEFLDSLSANLGKKTATRQEIIAYCEGSGSKYPHWLVKKDGPHYIKRGLYSLEPASLSKKTIMPVAPVNTQPPAPSEPAPVFQHIEAVEIANSVLIPEVDPLYVSWGHFSSIKQIVQSGMFFPVYITGLSGNGKTLMVEQVCAELSKKLYRVNITTETEEDDLLGGFRLVNGETVWSDGPVVRAMQDGALLLLDEVDLGDEKLMCLQPILEGKGVFLKKINKFIKPAPGFNIIATANTKGQGSEDGKFVGTNVMNEAFLERFPLTFEQPYPNRTVEKNILKKVLNFCVPNQDDLDADAYVNHLADFAKQTRKTYDNEGCSEVITTRRLVHIIKAYSIFGDKLTALKHCISRFDTITQESFLETYRGLDPVFIAEKEEAARLEAEQKQKELEQRDESVSAIFSEASS